MAARLGVGEPAPGGAGPAAPTDAHTPGTLQMLVRQGGIATTLNALALLSGLVLFAGVAALFGPGHATDAFFLALSIPTLFVGLALGTASGTLIPALTECRVQRPDRVGALVGSALGLAVAVAVAAATLGGLLTPAALAAAGRALTPEVRRLVVVDVLLLAPFVISQAAITVLAMASSAAGCFWLSPFSALIRQAITLGAAWLLISPLGALALPVAFSIGSVAQLLVICALWSHADTPIRLGWRVHEELRRPLRLAVPLLLGTSMLHLTIVVFRFLAAQLPPGSVTAFDYATRIYAALVDVVGSGLLLVTLTDFARVHAHGDLPELRRRVTRAVTFTLFALLPVVVVGFVLQDAVIGVWLRSRAVDPEFRRVTAMTLGFLLLGLPLEMVGRLYVQLLLVRGAIRTVAATGVLRALVTIALAAAFLGSFKVPGLALAETLGLAVTVVAILAAAEHLSARSVRDAARSLPRLAGAALGAVAATVGVRHLSAGAPDLALLAIVGTSATVAYLALAWLLEVPEARHFRAFAFPRQGAVPGRSPRASTAG